MNVGRNTSLINEQRNSRSKLIKPKNLNGSTGPSISALINQTGQMTSSSLGAPKIMINEPNMSNTAINDFYSSQNTHKIPFNNPASGLKNYHTQVQYGTSSTAHSATGAA